MQDKFSPEKRSAAGPLGQQRQYALQVIRWAYTISCVGFPCLLVPLLLRGDPVISLGAEYVVIVGGASALWILRRDDGPLAGWVVTISFGLFWALGFLTYGPTFGIGFMGLALLLASFLFHDRVWVAGTVVMGGLAFAVIVHRLLRFSEWAFEPSPAEWLRMTSVVLVVAASGGLVFRRMQQGILVAWRREAAAQAQRAEAERELEKSRRLEAISQLAGGIAHDFNNILTAIIGYNALAALALDQGHPARQDIEESTLAATKAAELTRQLLAFGRRDEVSPRDIDVNEVLTSMERLLQRVAGDDVHLRYAPSPAPLVCRVDRGQFEQVIMNLAVNGRDAMPSGGVLKIEARPVTLDEAHLVHGVSAGEYALIEVGDNGTGIPSEVLEHIFEPFFTTKGLGKGTGLGLATCHGVVKQAGGSIAVATELNLGTSFKVYFPLTRSSAAADLAEPALTAV